MAILCVMFFITVSAQEVKRETDILSVGLNYGRATENSFPFNNRNYTYETQYFKGQVNYVFSQKKRLNFELNIEPSVYFSEHQLLNKGFIQYNSSPDFMDRRERFSKEKTFQEYVLGLGLVMRLKISKKVSSYLLGSVGPMFSNGDTERLKKGFAFSDIFGFGLSYRLKKISFDSRLTIRHNSNANLSKPNHGHNSVGIESGISFRIK